MPELKFEWDNNKADKNIKKHKVSFEEAQTVFRDPLACIFDDKSHSTNEKREIIIGHSEKDRLLIVCFTEMNENVLRIFSSRPATRRERRDYEKNRMFGIG